ncbi:MAG TPA: NADH-quinone oxidoreductase subunit C [Acidimicrobiales bacterium]|nr:NADH-quinone oxidoreductase subunit C [Acidimicrobiales bacterium]
MSETTAATDEPVAPDAAPEPELLHGAPVVRVRGQRVVHASRDELVGLVRTLRDEGWLQCLDVIGVDQLANPHRDLPEGIAPERFELVVLLISHSARERLRICVQVPESDPVVPTLFEVHPGTEAMEREAFDLFGIRFDGHPDLTRILMPEDWEGHPLRKDYGIGRIPVQFKDAPDA